jgi:adenine-specific DNA methylase
MKFKADQTSQKLRGGYYTPQNLADYVTRWVLSTHPASVLEPSCGDGAFIQAIHNNNGDKAVNLECFELLISRRKKPCSAARPWGFPTRR